MGNKVEKCIGLGILQGKRFSALLKAWKSVVLHLRVSRFGFINAGSNGNTLDDGVNLRSFLPALSISFELLYAT